MQLNQIDIIFDYLSAKLSIEMEAFHALIWRILVVNL